MRNNPELETRNRSLPFHTIALHDIRFPLQVYGWILSRVLARSIHHNVACDDQVIDGSDLLDGLAVHPREHVTGNRDSFRIIEQDTSGHAFNPELLAKAVLRDPDIRIGEAPFVTKGRKHGTTNAFTPGAIADALYDVFQGYRSVVSYREDVINEQDS